MLLKRNVCLCHIDITWDWATIIYKFKNINNVSLYNVNITYDMNTRSDIRLVCYN